MLYGSYVHGSVILRPENTQFHLFPGMMMETSQFRKRNMIIHNHPSTRHPSSG